jgi:hypothetical protein
LLAVAVVAVLLASGSYASRAHAAKPRALLITASAGFDYTTGEYETDSTTDLWYVPFALRLGWEPFAMKITIPYLSVSGVGVDGDRPLVNATGAGLGDIIVQASYAYIPDNLLLPVVELTAKFKIPTADEDESLGTGEADYILQINLFQSLGNFSPYFSVNYRFVGDSPDFALHNAWFVSLGAGYLFAPNFSAGISYDWRQSATPGYGDSHELVPYVSFRFARRFQIGPYLVIGLSQNAPDIGVGTQLAVSF